MSSGRHRRGWHEHGVEIRSIEHGEHLATLGIDPRGDQRMAGDLACFTRHRLERRDGNDSEAAREGQPLHGRDPDAKAREGSRAGGDGEQIDVVEADTCGLERAHQFTGQPLSVRDRGIAAYFGQRRAVPNDRDAARSRGRVECQDQQSPPPVALLQMLYCRFLASFRGRPASGRARDHRSHWKMFPTISMGPPIDDRAHRR